MIDLILPIKNDDSVMIFQFAMITKESYHWLFGSGRISCGRLRVGGFGVEHHEKHQAQVPLLARALGSKGKALGPMKLHGFNAIY